MRPSPEEDALIEHRCPPDTWPGYYGGVYNEDRPDGNWFHGVLLSPTDPANPCSPYTDARGDSNDTGGWVSQRVPSTNYYFNTGSQL